MKTDSQNQEEHIQERDIRQILLQASEGLLYPSESDYPFEYFEWDATNKEILSAEDVMELTGKPAGTPVKILSLDHFFDPVVRMQDWYGEEEKATVERFITLKETLQHYLSDIQVFKMGTTEIDAYIAGKKSSGKWSGLATKVIET